MNALKRWIVRKEVQSFVDNAIKESTMSAPMKSWLIGLANAGVSALAGGLGGLTAGTSGKQALLIAAISASVSIVKWVAQHPIPGGTQ